MKLRSFLIFGALAVASVSVVLVATETALRVLSRRSTGVSGELRFGELDTLTGWRPTPNYAVQYRRKTADGVDHLVSYSSLAKGFRLYGDVNAKRRKLLIIGDSFTHAVNASTNKTYAALLATALDVEVFSYGAGGFGTLQELMVLKDVVDSIKPDIVLLQFCSNDFINNSFELEERSTINNNRLVRPYLGANDTIRYRNPFPHETYMGLARRYQLFALIGNKVLYARRKSVETIVARNPNDSAMVRSVNVTRSLIEQFKERLPPNTRMFVFSADDGNTKFRNFPDVEEVAQFSGVAEKALSDIVASVGVTYIPGIGSAVADAEAKGVTVHDLDQAHWSEAGHAIVASVLANRLAPLLK